MRKIAVIIFNLGGPDDQAAVAPFLFNLFNDRQIMDVPQPLRFIIARLIAWRRTKKAQNIYAMIGGKSPILEETQAQAKALEEQLKNNGDEYKVFVCMRYWHPMSATVVKNVKSWGPDHIVMLPLYPQFSTTTTASSFDEWDRVSDRIGLKTPTSKLCCYPQQKSIIAAQAKLVREQYWKAAESGRPRVLFSAHGLPEKIIHAGDPYQYQVEKTASAIAQILAIDDLDYHVCYQSKVGPLKWIGPSTEEEIERAGKERRPVVVVPIAFVSEHSETLVELDIDYRRLAERAGVPAYLRVPALGVDHFFIDGLKEMVLAKSNSTGIGSDNDARFCLRQFGGCPCKG